MRRTMLLTGVLLVVITPACPGQVVAYSDTATFSGGAFPNGGAQTLGANTVTRYVADDITVDPTMVGQSVTQFSFSVANLNGVPVTARPRVTFFAIDGPGNAP